MIDTRNFVSFPSYGIDEADGTFITKSDFLQRWRQADYQSSSINIKRKNNFAFCLSFFFSEGRLCDALCGVGVFLWRKKDIYRGNSRAPNSNVLY
jgi:hypothetical protein